MDRLAAGVMFLVIALFEKYTSHAYIQLLCRTIKKCPKVMFDTNNKS